MNDIIYTKGMKNMNNMISSNLKYLRENKELTQEQFAEKINVSRQTVAKWESGESVPDIERCVQIAMFYGVSLDSLAMCPLDEKSDFDGDDIDGKYIFGIVKVGERGQVVIPKHAREVYDIKPGSKLLAVGDEKGMAFAKIKSLLDFRINR